MNDSIIKEIGRSYIVSSLIPSIFAVLLAVVLFSDLLSSVSSTTESLLFFEGSTGLIIAFTFWLAFALYSAQDPIVKLFEGYYFEKIKWIGSNQRSETKALHGDLAKFNRQASRLKKLYELGNPQDSRILKLKKKVEKEKLHLIPNIQEHEIRAPLNEANLLKTKFGNVLRASEIYASERYGIDGLTLWPRLAHVLPNEFTASLEEQNNKLMFLLNSSLLAFILALASLIGAIVRITFPSVALMFSDNLVWFFLIFLLAGYLIYRASVTTAEDFGLFIRTGFDLYRFDLLIQLNQCLPVDLNEEMDIWKKLHLFFISGQKLGPVHLEYSMNKNVKEKAGSKLEPDNEELKEEG